jgi:alpha-L-rhamnosidase
MPFREFRVTASLLAMCIVLTITAGAQNPLAVRNLRCEYKTDPVGIDVKKPRLSWQLESAERGVLQKSYEIRVGNSEGDLFRGKTIWTSGMQASDASNQMEYQGPTLQSAHSYYWQVRVTDQHGHASGWSDIAHWEMGLLNPDDWKANWITSNLVEDDNKSNPSPLLRREFGLKKRIARARLYATAMGLYEFHINGRRVGDQYLTPGWTAYDFRYQYQTYDVTNLLRAGQNAMGAILGDGWFRGRMTWDDKRDAYGTKLALLAQLQVTYSDGAQEMIGTDDHWKAATGAVLMSDIYDGETYDARREPAGWTEPGYNDKRWSGVNVVPSPNAKLVAPAGPPVQEIEQIKPVNVLTTPSGETVVDMGQNMVGWIRFRLTAPTGTTVTLKHAEVLDKAGNLYTENLRSAKQMITYTARGGGVETFEPHFTFQGFRYVAVSGWPGKINPDDFTGIVVHSDMARTGTFETSSTLLNRLQHNIIWGQKGNFVDVPTDCPQRDERLGWTGDAEVFAPTASFNHDTAAFYTKWLKDVALDQEDDGAVPHVIPNVLSHKERKGAAASAGWADVAVIVPWAVYQAYGDKRILEDQYASMKAWVEYMRRQAGNNYIWNNGFSFGDWLAFATTDSDYPGATTDKDFIQTAYFARSTDLLRKTAEVLGKEDDAQQYADLEEKIKAAFRQEFVTANGRLSPNTQTAYALALAFGLLPDSLRASAAERLAADVRKFGHLTTGFLGTPVLSQVLSDYGYLDEAYMLLNRTEYPSWLYPVTKGATTIWERWDGLKPDGTFQSPGMNSFNHYAYGAIGDWMYGVVAGIAIDEKQPGYKHVLIQPHPGGGLTFAKASINSMYGKIASEWHLDGNKMTLHVEVPPNTTATVQLPNTLVKDVTESGKSVENRDDVSGVKQLEKAVVLEIGAGAYEFESLLQKAQNSTPPQANRVKPD